jgi:hypothetical protein
MILRKLGVTGIMSCGLILSGCSYSITMVHTQGEATDVVDEVQRTDADVKTNLSIPAI